MTPAELLEIAAGVLLVSGSALLLVRARRRGRRAPVPDHVADRVAAATEESEFQRILVPTLGGVLSDRMVSMACKMARSDESEVEVLYVVEIPMALPATAELPDEIAKAEEALSEADLIGRASGVPIRGRVEKGRFAGKVIVDVAASQGADLIILGAPARKRHGEWGRTVEYVFRNAPCDVIIERASSKGGSGEERAARRADPPRR